MKSRVAISIVVPAYNEEKMIGQCLTSLKTQQFSHPYEIIVANNNSTDKTAEIARSLGVKIIKATRQGVVHARQAGLKIARGEIVVGADCDCTYPPDWLSHIYSSFIDPRVICAGGPAIAEKTPYWAYLIYKLGFGFVRTLYQSTGYTFYLGGFNLAFRRTAFLKIGGYHTYLDFGGDEWDVLTRLRRLGKIVFVPRAFMYVSTRRYRVGFLQWFFIHNLYYYILNYWLAKLFKKTFIHPQPVRDI